MGRASSLSPEQLCGLRTYVYMYILWTFFSINRNKQTPVCGRNLSNISWVLGVLEFGSQTGCVEVMLD